MVKFSFVVMVFSVLIMACENGRQCDVCGNYRLVNWSKSETIKDPLQENYQKRTIHIINNNGDEHISFWNWNDKTPEKNWFKQGNKQIELNRFLFDINENQSWNWMVEISENDNKKDDSKLVRFQEKGTWSYVGDHHIEFSNYPAKQIFKKKFRIDVNEEDGFLTLNSVREENNNSIRTTESKYSLLSGDIIISVNSDYPDKITALKQ